MWWWLWSSWGGRGGCDGDGGGHDGGCGGGCGCGCDCGRLFFVMVGAMGVMVVAGAV